MSGDRYYEQIQAALELAYKYGSIDGAHHKMWVIDQMVRALTGDHYKQWVIECKENEYGHPDVYEWDEGIEP